MGKDEKLSMSIDNSIAKARSGVYEDNSKNRRLHRVGQHYGDPRKPDDTPLEARTRVSFPDVPHSSKVNLQKYLSGAMKKKFDMTETMSTLKTTEDVQKFHDRMVGFFEEKFDTFSKADRAGWLWVIIQTKAELVKRLAAGDPNGEPIDMEDQDVNFGPEEEIIDRVATELKKNNSQMEETKSSVEFMDLSDEAKNEVLRRAGFTGMVYREGFYGDGGSYDVRQFEDKKSIFAQIDDDTWYNPIDSDSTWTIAYSNGTRIDTSDFVGEKKKIRSENATWAIGWGLRGYSYWAKDAAAEAEMMRELGLDKWVDGERQERSKYQENIDNLEVVYGEAHPMSAQEADNKAPNPKYGQNELYRINCQSCVVAYELRRRGFDVEALPRSTDQQARLAKDSGLAFIDPETGKTVEPKGFSGLPLGQTHGYENEFSKTNLKANFEALTKEPGRYHFSYVYTCCHKRYGHIVCVERFPDGRLVMYDPQSGQIRHWRDISKNMRKKFLHRVMRVDDKLINIELVKGVVKKKEARHDDE